MGIDNFPARRYGTQIFKGHLTASENEAPFGIFKYPLKDVRNGLKFLIAVWFDHHLFVQKSCWPKKSDGKFYSKHKDSSCVDVDRGVVVIRKVRSYAPVFVNNEAQSKLTDRIPNRDKQSNSGNKDWQPRSPSYWRTANNLHRNRRRLHAAILPEYCECTESEPRPELSAVGRAEWRCAKCGGRAIGDDGEE